MEFTTGTTTVTVRPRGSSHELGGASVKMPHKKEGRWSNGYRTVIDTKLKYSRISNVGAAS